MYRLYRIKDFFRHDLAHGIRNLIAWFPLVWRDRDWDWVFLARIMEFKLRRMSSAASTHWATDGSEQDAQHMLRCADILAELVNDYPQECTTLADFKAHEKKLASQQALLGKIIGKRMRYWWD